MAAPKKTTHPGDGSPTAREAILQAALAAIASGGESSVRVTEVAREAGVTQGMVSYYFKDREGLIVEAQLAGYQEAVTHDSELLLDGVKRINSVDEFQEFVKLATRQVVSTNRLANRMSRVGVLGASVNRPDLRERVVAVQDQMISDMEEVARIAQERGLFRTDFSPRALGEFVTSYTLGLVVADLDPHRPDDEAIAHIIDILMDGLRPRT